MKGAIYSKGAALIIGINEYEAANKLSKAINDAKAVADALSKLSFYVDLFIDANIDICDKAIDNFISSLDKFDVGVFYFAGHGIEVDGENYLLAQNTPVENKAGAIRYSINLQNIVKKMHQSGCKTNILIIDACRDNPYPNTRGFGTTNLAPMFAPKGTIIAYSSSPGERAKDGGMGDNSIYTGALIKHINEPGLPIEEFFKRVRTSVYTLSQQQQTSWEHTSLIGNFSFNSGQLIHSLGLPYSPIVIADKDFDYSDPLIEDIIKKFKSYNYYTQNTALDLFKRLPLKDLNSNQLFIIGRNILQAAYGECWECQSFINDGDALERYSVDGNNHLLNGILFEMYFNSEGHFRFGRKKGYNVIDALIGHSKRERLKSAFSFIKTILLPFSNRLLFYPSESPMSVSINVLANITRKKELWSDKEVEICLIDAIKFNDIDLLNEDGTDGMEFFVPTTYNSIGELTKKICEIYTIPEKYLTITSSIEFENREIYLNGKFRYL